MRTDGPSSDWAPPSRVVSSGPRCLGWLIDHLAGTFPVFLLIGLVLGIAATARVAYTEMSKFLGS